jgi:hypothetical protein
MDLTLHVSGGPDIEVSCADITHDLRSSDYEYGILDHNGFGAPISQALSNRIGHIAELGFNSADGLLASAAQLAIWSLEYGVAPTFFNTTVHSDFDTLLGDVFANNGQYATALIPEGGWPENPNASQQMVLGVAAVPEASTWAMMVMGFAGLGFAAFRRAGKSRVPALA